MSELTEQQQSLITSMGLQDEIKGHRVLITGASGFVGLHLCEALVGLGAEVYALSRHIHTHKMPHGVITCTVDLSDLTLVKSCLSSIKPEVVYHLASLVNTRQHLDLVLPTFKNNLEGSINLFVSLAEGTCKRLVVVGSSEEPSAGRLGAIANSPYAAAKEAETNYARMFYDIFSLPVVLTRPFMGYGPRQPVEKVIPYVITSLLNTMSPEIGSGKRVCDLIFVQDLVMGLILAGFKPDLNGKSVDLGMGVGITIREVVLMICELMGTTIVPKFGAIPDRLHESPQIANVEETFRLLGYRPIWPLFEGVKATIEWYRTHPEFYIIGR